MMQNNQQQQAHPAQVAQEFMSRTELKGREVEVYAQTFNWLAAILEGTLVVHTAEEYDVVTSAARKWTNLQDEKKDTGDFPVLTDGVQCIDKSEEEERKLGRDLEEGQVEAVGDIPNSAIPVELDAVG